MNEDMIAEICTELRLLSAFAAHFYHAEAESPNKDVEMLLSGLALLAAHAQNVKGTGDSRESKSCSGCDTLSPQTPVYDETQSKKPLGLENGAMYPHKWIFEVLRDLTTYTRKNNLLILADSLENLCKLESEQLSATKPLNHEMDHPGLQKIVAFAPGRRPKFGFERAP